MADIALVTADKVSVDTSGPNTQHTGVAAEAITAGAPVLFDTNGKWVNGDANATGLKGAWGIATRTVAAGEALTVIRRGKMSGWAFTSTNNTYGGSIYLSDTVGRISDVAGTTSIVLGHIVPVFGAALGTAADKELQVEVTGTGASA
jgi:hypothetical protein